MTTRTIPGGMNDDIVFRRNMVIEDDQQTNVNKTFKFPNIKRQRVNN